MTTPLLELRHVSATFVSRGRTVSALRDCSLSLDSGEVLAIIGESGSGKSTLARVIAGLVIPTQGDVLFRSHDLARVAKPARKDLRQRIQMVFQDPDASLNPAHRVSTIVSEPLIVRRYGAETDIRRRVIELLDQVQLDPSLLERKPSQLSGGQKQRVAIARALAMEPELLLADEPLSSLDVSTAASIAELFQALRRRLGISMVFISHDLTAVRRLATRVAVLHAGRIVEAGPVALLDTPAHPYTRRLVASAPAANGSLNFALVEEIDALPKLAHESGACGYRDQCSQRSAICATAPALLPERTNPAHSVRCHLQHS